MPPVTARSLVPHLLTACLLAGALSAQDYLPHGWPGQFDTSSSGPLPRLAEQSVDLDGSGLPDVVATGLNDVRVLFDPGAGLAGLIAPAPAWVVVAPASAFGANASQVEVQVVDVDGNGWADLACEFTAGASPQFNLVVLFNQGFGVFTGPQVAATGLMGSVTFGDFDGDGLLDFLDGAGFYDLHLQTPSGSFLLTASFSENAWAVDDFNGDGADDVLAWSSGLLRLGGPGGLTAQVNLNSTASPLFAVPISAADWNRDGIADLFLRSLASGGPTTYIRFGGTTNPLQTGATRTLPFGNNVNYVARDIDGDGWQDLLRTTVVIGSGGTLQMWRGHATGFSSNWVSVWTPMVAGIHSAYIWSAHRFGDWDADGDEDLLFVAANAPGNTWTLSEFLENRTLVGSGCSGSTGTPLNLDEPSFLGNGSFGFRLSNAAPSAPAALFATTALSSSMACGPVLDLTTLVAPLAVPVTTSASGDALVPLPLPNQPGLSGLRLFTQWAVLDPAGTFATPVGPLAVTPARTLTVF